MTRSQAVPGASRLPLVTGAIAALLASTCCLGPLVLVLIGFSGTWLARLSALAPYQPLFIAIALVSLAVAFPRLFRRAERCGPGPLCRSPAARTAQRIGFILVALLLLVVITAPYTMPLFY